MNIVHIRFEVLKQRIASLIFPEDRFDTCFVSHFSFRGMYFVFTYAGFSGENDSLNDEWAFGFYSNPEWEPQQWSRKTASRRWVPTINLVDRVVDVKHYR